MRFCLAFLSHGAGLCCQIPAYVACGWFALWFANLDPAHEPRQTFSIRRKDPPGIAFFAQVADAAPASPAPHKKGPALDVGRHGAAKKENGGFALGGNHKHSEIPKQGDSWAGRMGLMQKNSPGSSEKPGLGGDPSHPHGVTGCPSTVGEFCARRLIKRDFPLVTERGEFIGVDDHRNYDGSLKFRGCPFALGISLPLIEKEREAILPVVHDFSDKRVLVASVPRCKVHFPAP